MKEGDGGRRTTGGEGANGGATTQIELRWRAGGWTVVSL